MKIYSTLLLCVLLVGCSEKLIGGDTDDHGCLIGAGYSWCEAKQKCLRVWEEYCTPEDLCDQDSIVYTCKDYIKVISKIPGKGTLYLKEDKEISCPVVAPDAITDECKILLSDSDCTEVCAFCTSDQRGPVACTMDYSPVCGYFNSEIQCVKYPCAETYSNGCTACSDSKVEYWVNGECPV